MEAMVLTELALASDPSLAAFFLGELATLVARRAAAASATERESLAAAVFGVFLDCVDLGLEAEAQEIMGQLYPEVMLTERLVA